MKYFGYQEYDLIYCEVPGCGHLAVDIHHIDPRGMGGSKLKDYIENLMALCRFHHEQAEAKKLTKELLRDMHNFTINTSK